MTEKLYLLLSEDGELSYCTYNQDNHKIDHIKTGVYENNILTDLINRHDQCILTYASACFTLVPSQLFDQYFAYDYLKLSRSVSPDTTVMFKKIIPYGIHIVYAFPSDLSDIIKQKKDKLRVMHHADALMEVFRLYTGQGGEAVLVNSEANKMDIVVFNGKRPLLCERFNYSSPTEFIYFILNTFTQLKLSVSETPLFLSGKIETGSEEYIMAARHFSKIAFAENKHHLVMPHDVKFHRHFNLLSALLCE